MCLRFLSHKNTEWTFNCSDSCSLVKHSRADKQGVAAGVWAAWFLLSFLPNLSLFWMDAGKCRRNSLDCSRGTDNMTAQGRSTENVQCSCLSVWGGKSHSGAASLLPASRVISPPAWLLKDIHSHTNTLTHTHRAMMVRRRLAAWVCVSLILPFAGWTQICNVVCVRECERACDRETAGDGEQWPVTYWRSQDTSISRTGAYMPSFLSNPACPHTAQACFVRCPPALSSDPSLKSHTDWQPASIVSLTLYSFLATLSGLGGTFMFKQSFFCKTF